MRLIPLPPTYLANLHRIGGYVQTGFDAARASAVGALTGFRFIGKVTRFKFASGSEDLADLLQQVQVGNQ